VRKSISRSLFAVLIVVGASSAQVASAAHRELPWGPSTPLVRGTASPPHEFGDWLHGGDDGSMLVTVRSARGLTTASRPPRGRFGVPREIRTGPAEATDELRPIVAAGGRSLLLWQPKASGSSLAGVVVDPVAGARRLALPATNAEQVTSFAFDARRPTLLTGLFGDPLQVINGSRLQTLAPAEDGASSGSTASSRSGAVVAWRAPVPCPELAVRFCQVVRAAVRPAGAAAFGPASTLDVVSTTGAELDQPRVHAAGEQLVVTWRRDDPDAGIHAVRVAVASGSGFLPIRSVPGTEPTSYVVPAGTSPCGISTSGNVTTGDRPRAIRLLPRAGGGSLLFVLREDVHCSVSLQLSTLSPAGEPSAPQELPGLRSRPYEPPIFEAGPQGRALIVSGEDPDLAFARLDSPAAPVSVKDAEFVTSGWDGNAAIVVAQVRCDGKTRRTDAWILTGSRTKRVRVWPCQRGQPPMEIDGAGRLVLVGHLKRKLFVARASCRLTAWAADPRAACRPPRA
jgi:hypothetical protein